MLAEEHLVARSHGRPSTCSKRSQKETGGKPVGCASSRRRASVERGDESGRTSETCWRTVFGRHAANSRSTGFPQTAGAPEGIKPSGCIKKSSDLVSELKRISVGMFSGKWALQDARAIPRKALETARVVKCSTSARPGCEPGREARRKKSL